MTTDRSDQPSPAAPAHPDQWSFAKQPRWLVGHVLVLTVVVLFVNLGLWQLRRLEERQALNGRAEAHSEAPIEPLGALLSRQSDPDDVEYRTVSVEGVYQHESEILVRSRTLNGEPGFHVVTLLVGNPPVLINRGFVPLRFDEPPVLEAAPPPGQIEVIGRVRQSVTPPAIGAQDPESGPLSHVFWLNVERLQQQFQDRLAPVYVELISQEPPQSGVLPLPLPPPTLDEGPHRSYAIQWFSFVVITLVGYTFLLRRAARRPGLA